MTALTIDGREPLSAAAVNALDEICDHAEDLPGSGTVALHVTGAPNPDWTGALTVGLVTKWERMVRRLERLPAVTVAVASGDCGGPALDVLLATDLRIATPDTRLLVPLDGDATWPGMAAHRLVQQAGAARVRRAVLFGTPIPAPEALALGLLDELADDPAGAAEATAELAAALSGKELAIRRRLLFDAVFTSFEDALGQHLAACDRALRRATAEEAS
ncbi:MULTISPECIES: enoyl-CoA-hydratase DpgB [Streptomyces]|uniref:enoyl-CoA-hydratase DpgB n=1 Tax=Streptomyces TaxID=1883 RepID=UPI00292E284B|nr:enoyl-CoA-hydratase DpgB [Streptomyces sp. NEAU-HV9]